MCLFRVRDPVRAGAPLGRNHSSPGENHSPQEQGRSSRDQSQGAGASKQGPEPRSRGGPAGTGVISVGAAGRGLTSHLHSPQEQGRPWWDQSRGAAGAQAGPSAAGAAMLQEGLTARLNRRSPCGHSHQEARGWPRWGHQHVGSGGPGRILAGYAGRSVLGPWDAGKGRPPAPRCLHPCPLWVSGPVRGSSGTWGRC